MEKILFVGGSGVLGRACLNNLLTYDVSIIGRLPSFNFLKSKKHTYYQLDICDVEGVEKFLNQTSYSHLVYLAWPLTPPHNSLDHVNFAATSLDFIAKFAHKNPSSRIIFTGSIHETGTTSGKVPNDFKGALPTTLYGICKKHVYDCMQALLNHTLKHISFGWVRLSNVYGPDDHAHKLLPTLIANAIKNKTVALNNPDAVVDFVHVEDAAKGVCSALFSNHTGIINVGGGKGYNLRDIQSFIESFFKKKMEEKDTVKIGAQQVSGFGAILDITDSFQVLKYAPTISIEDGITECIKHTQKLKENESN